MTTCYQRIKSDLIIPGKGSPIKNGIVIIKDDIIHYVGTAENQPKDIATFERDIFIPIIMPGLWDCHVHFFGFNKVAMSSSKELFDVIATTPAAIAVVRSLSALSKCIEYGITSVREVGGYGCHLKKLVNEGTIIQSPNIYPAGKCLGITGGHGDFHNYPLEFMCQLSKNDNITTLCDGHTECLKAVRSNIRNGADCIKVHATGGVLSINDALDARQFSDSELKTIVSEAQRSGKICAAHCHGRDGIEAAIECGVYTIEHGSFLDEALAQKMKAEGTMLVPTRYVSEMFNELIDADKDGSKFTESMRIKAKKCIYAGRNAFQIALKYGLKVAMGTGIYSYFNLIYNCF